MRVLLRLITINYMKKILTLFILVLAGWATKAQSTNGQGSMSDSTHRHHAYHNWSRSGGSDSLHKRNFNGFSRDRGEAMNHFNRQGGGMDRFHSYDRNRFGGHGPRLHYSPEQRKQMQAINTEYHKKSADLYKNDNLTLREYKAQLLVLQKEKKSKLQNLLTPEQKNQVAAFKKRADENAQVMAAAHLERMKIRLKLSDNQVTAIKSQQQKMRTQIQSIRENENLMADQKREQIRSLAMKQKDEIKSVLTPEQVSQLDSMHKQRFGGK